MSKILFIGPIPPPYGGVSIHILRLSHLLKRDFEISFIDESKQFKTDILNIRNLHFIKYFSLIKKCDVISIHSGNSKLRFFHILSGLFFKKRIILTIHAYPHKKIFLLRFLEKMLFNRCNKIILVNEQMASNVKFNENKLIIKHAFIPPYLAEEKELPQTLKEKINQLKSSGKKIICGNASRLDRYNNEDLYGVDLCLGVAKILKDINIKAIILFNVAEIDKYQDAYDQYQNHIERENLQHYIYLFNDRISFVRLMELSDIIIRPTNTDGDSLTVREAIFLNKPIIASDIVKRPEGTIIFKNRDVSDLAEKIIETSDTLNAIYRKEISKDSFDYHFFYKEIFNNIMIG